MWNCSIDSLLRSTNKESSMASSRMARAARCLRLSGTGKPSPRLAFRRCLERRVASALVGFLRRNRCLRECGAEPWGREPRVRARERYLSLRLKPALRSKHCLHAGVQEFGVSGLRVNFVCVPVEDDHNRGDQFLQTEWKHVFVTGSGYV